MGSKTQIYKVLAIFCVGGKKKKEEIQVKDIVMDWRFAFKISMLKL